MIRTRKTKTKTWWHLSDFAAAIGVRNLHQSIRKYTSAKNLKKFGVDARSSVWINAAGILDTWQRSKKCQAALIAVLHEGETISIDTIGSIVNRLETSNETHPQEKAVFTPEP